MNSDIQFGECFETFPELAMKTVEYADSAVGSFSAMCCTPLLSSSCLQSLVPLMGLGVSTGSRISSSPPSLVLLLDGNLDGPAFAALQRGLEAALPSLHPVPLHLAPFLLQYAPF